MDRYLEIYWLYMNGYITKKTRKYLQQKIMKENGLKEQVRRIRNEIIK